MHLSDGKTGQLLRLVEVCDATLETRLRRMGLYPGDCLRVLRKAPLRGPVLVAVGGRELALGRAIAQKLKVEAA